MDTSHLGGAMSDANDWGYTPEDREAAMERIRKEIKRRIREGDRNISNFYRAAKRTPEDEHADRGTIPDSNFYRPVERSQFALHMRLNGTDFFLPLVLIVVGNDNSAWCANREESIAILRNEEKWSDGIPVWAQSFTPDFSLEDQMFLREMQLFKSGDDHGLRN